MVFSIAEDEKEKITIIIPHNIGENIGKPIIHGVKQVKLSRIIHLLRYASMNNNKVIFESGEKS